MPKISLRGVKMPASPIRKLASLANNAKVRGVKVYHLNIGQPDILTPQVGLDALKNINLKILEYCPSDGLQSFREKLVKYYGKFDIHVRADEIFIATGGSEAINFTFGACLDAGDELIVPEPTYANYIAFAQSFGIEIKPVMTRIEDGFALPPIEKFEEMITPKTKAILICNPNNPTGTLYTRQEMNRLRDIVKKHDLFLFSDEVYREFCYTDEPHISSFHLKGIEDNVVMMDSVSKRYSECGIRIGTIVTKNKEVHDAVLKWGQARLSPPLLGQIVAEASLDVSEEYIQSVHNEYISRRDFLVERLNRIPGCFTPTPQGAFYTVVRLPVDDADRFCAWCLSDFSYEGQTVMMAPGSGFYSASGLGRNEARIAYVLNKDDLNKALTVLEKALEAYPYKI